MMQEISVFFDKSDKVYRPGEPVRLRTLIKSQKVKVKHIKVFLVGFCETNWVCDQEQRRLGGRETLFNHEVILVGKRNFFGIIMTEMCEGVHSYESIFELPRCLPSSFEHPKGRIRYEVVVRAEYQASEKILRENFTVVSSLDLTLLPHLARPVKIIKTATVGYWFWPYGPISVVLNMPRTGFVLNDAIPIILDVENDSKADLEKVYVELRQRMVFSATSPHPGGHELIKTDILETLVALKALPGVPKGEKRTFREEIVVPREHVYANFEACRLITSEYFLKVRIPSTNLTLQQEVVFGTFPFQVLDDGLPSLPPSYEETIANEASGGGGFIQYPSLPVTPSAPVLEKTGKSE